jgi:hypothetical protein
MSSAATTKWSPWSVFGLSGTWRHRSCCHCEFRTGRWPTALDETGMALTVMAGLVPAIGSDNVP